MSQNKNNCPKIKLWQQITNSSPFTVDKYPWLAYTKEFSGKCFFPHSIRLFHLEKKQVFTKFLQRLIFFTFVWECVVTNSRVFKLQSFSDIVFVNNSIFALRSCFRSCCKIRPNKKNYLISWLDFKMFILSFIFILKLLSADVFFEN